MTCLSRETHASHIIQVLPFSRFGFVLVDGNIQTSRSCPTSVHNILRVTPLSVVEVIDAPWRAFSRAARVKRVKSQDNSLAEISIQPSRPAGEEAESAEPSAEEANHLLGLMSTEHCLVETTET